MRRIVWTTMAVCGFLATCAEDVGVTFDANGDVTVAAGGAITVGPNAASTNNSQNVTLTFENGGTIQAIPTANGGTTIADYHRLWRDSFVTGTLTLDYSELPATVATPEIRRSLVATNGTVVVSADRQTLSFGAADVNRKRHFPLYDVPNLVFAAGSGTVDLLDDATLRDIPGIASGNVTFRPNGARLAIAGQGIVARRIVQATGRASFNDYGKEIILLDESYVPDGATLVFGASKTFRIYPADVVVTNEVVESGNNSARVFWRQKEGSGVVPFDIDLNGGTLELVTTRPTYEFTGKIYRGGTIDLQGPYTRTLAEVEGTFTFKNTTSAGGTVVFRKVNPGSRLCNGGRVAFVFEDGALPSNARTVTEGSLQYVFVPAADGTVDLNGLSGKFRATSTFVPLATDAAFDGDALASAPKVGVANGATVSLALDGSSVPTVVGGEGTFAVSTTFSPDLPAVWFDASKAYDAEAKGAPYYAPPASAREGYDFGNIFFTNGYPFVEAWYDVRGEERSCRFYLSRYYDSSEYKVFTHGYPYLARGDFAGRTLTYLSFGEYGVANSTWSNDGPDTPVVTATMDATRRLIFVNRPAAITAVVMVFGSQQGGGIAMLGGGSFTRAGRTLASPVCKAAPANTTIWLDGAEVNPANAYFNGGWQVVSVVGAAANTVASIGQDKTYKDSGGQNYGEILFFTNAVTDVQRRQVERYLANKWGVATYQGPGGGGIVCPLRAEGRTGTLDVRDGAAVELRGTFAGSLTVDGEVTISERLPWTAADVPAEGRVDWYDADDAASLALTSQAGSSTAVSRQYPRGVTQATASSGFYLWGTGNRLPFAVTGARGLGVSRTWIDYNHPDGYTPVTSDGNVLRFMPWNHSSAGYAAPQTFRTLLVALDSGRGGGGTILGSGNVNGVSGDFRQRASASFADDIWPSTCSANVKGGVTRLNGAVVDQTRGFTGAPEVLSLTAAGNVSALCVDTYGNTESSGGVPKQQGTVQGEMLLYDSVLDADVLANLEAYLMGKWTGVLPDGWSDLREATVTAGTGTVRAVAAKLPKFGDGFTGTVAVPDAAFSFEFDGAAGTVANPFVARGATLSLPSAVTVNVACSNMQGAQEVSVPLFDVAGFANPVEWNFVPTGAAGKKLRLRSDGGALYLDVLANGMVILFR